MKVYYMMEMRVKSILAVILIGLGSSLFAQNKGEHCGTDRRFWNLLQTDSTALTKLRENHAKVERYLDSHVSRATTDTIITVPVVVHVIHSGQGLDTGANISDAQILSQIDMLNLCFNKQNEDTALVPTWYQSLIANVGIKFCLAMYDTSGNPTTGITRANIDSFAYQGQDFDNDVKPFTQWDPTRYFNIWTTDLGGGPNAGGDILGYSTMPNLGPANLDGIVIDYHYFGQYPANPLQGPFDLGKTAVHEAGHWLGLYHPFYPYPNGSGCAGMTPETCDTAGDYICDTPPEAEATYGLYPNLANCSCGDTSYYYHGYDMCMTFMDYVDDTVLDMFSIDQAAEMRAVLNTLRLSIQYDTAAGSCKYSIVDTTSTDSTAGLTALTGYGMNMAVSPNPSTGMVTLQYSIAEKGTLEIFNVMGQQILAEEVPELQKGTLVVNLNAQPPGIYFMRLRTPHSQKTLKLSIVR